MKRIKIISGEWKKRKIFVLSDKKLRPTLNRIRETLFNWIRPYISGSSCLDCFSGSGALSIEAISQNASFVTSIELDKNIFKQLIKNISLFHTKKIEALNINVLNFLKKRGNPYNLVFLDPPFNSNLLLKTIKLLEKNYWIKEDSLIYLESHKKTGFPNVPKSWKIYKKKISGNVLYCLFKHHG